MSGTTNGAHIYFTAHYVKPDSYVAEGTLVTLTDGTQKAVENLDGTEMLLVWNHHTGLLDYASIIFVDSEIEQEYEIIHLYFSDQPHFFLTVFP